LVVVSFRVIRAWDSLVLSLSANWETSLGDPDGLASNSSLSCSQSLIEQSLSLGDAVGHGVLEVWVRVHSDEVRGRDDSIDTTFSPGEKLAHASNDGQDWHTMQSRYRHDQQERCLSSYP